jgi:hypothetical protein
VYGEAVAAGFGPKGIDMSALEMATPARTPARTPRAPAPTMMKIGEGDEGFTAVMSPKLPAPEVSPPVKKAGAMKKAVGQLVEFAKKIQDENKKRKAIAAISRFVSKTKAKRAAKADADKVSEQTKKDMRRFELRRMTTKRLQELLSKMTGKPAGHYRQYKNFKTAVDLENEVLRLEGLL